MKSDLGGGKNLHLGIFITPKEYTRVHITSYFHNQQPTPLNVSQGTAQHLASIMSYRYADGRRPWQESVYI